MELPTTMDDLVASAATIDISVVSLGEEVVTRSRLERGVTNWGQRAAMAVLDGYWTLEQLDLCHQPGTGAKCSRCAANAWRLRQGLPPIKHCNFAREWIAANHEQWEALLRAKLRDEIATPDLPPAVGEGFG